ncbi:hypothetical protein KC325_g128 [Hortaea werneckii]|nr:hypothetical protein KC325_g128 [Hortaea werneckii]
MTGAHWWKIRGFHQWSSEVLPRAVSLQSSASVAGHNCSSRWTISPSRLLMGQMISSPDGDGSLLQFLVLLQHLTATRVRDAEMAPLNRQESGSGRPDIVRSPPQRKGRQAVHGWDIGQQVPGD